MNGASWSVGNWVGVLSLVFALLSGLQAVLIYSLKDKQSRAMWADWLERPRLWDGYRKGVGWGLDGLDRFFGRELSWQAFDRCLLLALAYPIGFFLLGWISEGPGRIGTFELLSDSASLTRRLFSAALLSIPGVLVWFWAFRVERHSDRFLRSLTAHWNIDPASRLFRLLYAIAAVEERVVVLAGIVAVTAAVVVAAGPGAVTAGAGAVAVAGAGVVGIALSGAGAGAGAGVIAIAVPVAVALAVAPYAGDLTVLVLLIWILLPVANAALDNASWAASRMLMRHLVKEQRRWRDITGHLIADAVLAAFFLFALAVVLPVVVQGANRLFDLVGWSIVEWGEILAAAVASPFSAGLLVTGMLFTTLVPTALHLGVAGAALVLKPMPGRRTVVAWLRMENTPALKKLGAVFWVQISAVVSLVLLIALGYGLWSVIALSGTTVGDFLYCTALWSANLVGGPGIPAP